MNDQQLRNALQEWDPATSLEERERLAIRRTLIARSRRRPLLRPALAWTFVATILLFAGIMLMDRPRPQPLPDAPAEARKNESGRRQIQYATAGGTRIIWTIDPDFSL